MALQHAREAGLVKLGQDQLNELWGPTFSFWEKWSCFWRAPVTIYLANVMVQVAITSFFTRFLTSQTEPEDHVEPFELVLASQRCAATGAVVYLTWALMCWGMRYFASTICGTELAHGATRVCGTELAYGATRVCGTELAYGATRVCGTELAYGATR
eukprot:3940755-Rhodomonas_salina.1